MPDLFARLRPLLLVAAAGGLAVGGWLVWQGQAEAAGWAWTAGTAVVLAGLLLQIAGSLARGDLGLDIVAALSMSAALAFGETLAAAVVALMYAGGQYLESFAEGRARREMTALLSRAPRSALRYGGEGGLEEVPIGAVRAGDRLLVGRGAAVAADGTVAAGAALLDESALTGEAMPVRHEAGEEVMSGALNAGDPFDLVALRPASESTFARIVRLVEQAQAARAPMVRLADRYAMAFLLVTLALAGGAWAVTGDPIRAVAVLVVSTPCPLILALPVALVAGLSRSARVGVLVKGGGALEALARARVLVLDKTGTLTEGRPRLLRTDVAPGVDPLELLRLAASLEQASHHPVARALVAEARGRGLTLSLPEGVSEVAGEGMAGVVDGRALRIGNRGFVGGGADRSPGPGEAAVAVMLDGQMAGELVLADRARPEAGALLAALRREGLERIVLATGDRDEVARAVAGDLGLDALRAGLSPEDKVAVVREEGAHGPVMMVGDGVNDAPALAAAAVGVAMGARGAAASAEAAQVVILVDRLDPLLAGLRTARRALAIARQSVAVGLGLSVLGMIAAAFGLLTPVQGALLQEAIDVAVILNALRVLGGEGQAAAARGAPAAA